MRKPCQRCIDSRIRREAIQPLHDERVRNALADDGSGPCCRDCSAADTIARLHGFTFEMARVAVANCRQESLRIPGMPMGLVGAGLVQASTTGELDEHHRWLSEAVPGWDEEEMR